MTEKLGIKVACCECSEETICYHVGALALHSGYRTPIFSYQNTTDDDSTYDADSDTALQPIQTVYVKSEILDPVEVESIPNIETATNINTASNVPSDAVSSFSYISLDVAMSKSKLQRYP